MSDSPPAKRRNVSVCAMPTMASQEDEDALRNEELLDIDSALLSQFERLPRELLWPIVEYVPESAFDIRLVCFFFVSSHLLIYTVQCSKTLQRQIDKYALRPEINLIQHFSLYSRQTLTNSLFMTAYPSVKNLFELRLKLLKTKYGVKFEVTRIASMTVSSPIIEIYRTTPSFSNMKSLGLMRQKQRPWFNCFNTALEG